MLLRGAILAVVLALVGAETPVAWGVDPDLIAYWPLDSSGADAADGHDLTLLGAPEFGPGPCNDAMCLDGATQYGQATDHVYSELPMSASAWVYLDASWSQRAYAISDHQNVPGDQGWALSIGTDLEPRRIYFWVGGGGPGYQMVGDTDLTVGQWHHVAVTVDTGGDGTIYLDGVEDGSASGLGLTEPGSSPEDVKFTVGARHSGEHLFNGCIDDVRLYSRSLTPAEVVELANGLSCGLVAHWPLNSDGTDMADDHDLTLYGSPVFACGAWDGAITLDGLTQYGQATDHVYSELPISATTWVYLDPSWSERAYAISDHQNVPGDQGWALSIGTDLEPRRIYFWVGGGGPGYQMVGDTDLTVGQWHHVAVTVDTGGDGTIYLDGVEDGSASGLGLTEPGSSPEDVKLTVGARHSAEFFFGGWMDDVRVYDRVLTSTQLAALAALQDFDGDGEGDACDPDIDNDGVANEPDACDFTPLGAIERERVILDPDDPLYGTIRGDLDGDCDCDLADFAILQGDFTGPNP